MPAVRRPTTPGKLPQRPRKTAAATARLVHVAAATPATPAAKRSLRAALPGRTTTSPAPARRPAATGRKKPARPATRGPARGKRPAPGKAPLPREVAITALDPQRKCGPNTSVLHMFRVDESLGGAHAETHLVFFDRHGWYCVHGRTCRAVEDVRKLSGFKKLDLDYNGRMRA